MTIRKLESKDINAVSLLFNELLYHLRDNCTDDYFDFTELADDSMTSYLQETISSDDVSVLVAKIDDTIVSFLSGEITNCFFPFSSTKKIGYIGGGYTLPTYRNRGIMKKMISVMEMFFEDKGISYIELNVLSENILGIRTWEKLGFKTFRHHMRKKI